MQEAVRLKSAEPLQGNVDEETLAMSLAVSLSESAYKEVKRDPEALGRVLKRVGFIMQAFLGCCLAAGADADELCDMLSGIYHWV